MSFSASSIDFQESENVSKKNYDLKLTEIQHQNRFPLENEYESKVFINYLISQKPPDLMINFIGNNYDQARRTFLSSVDEHFRQMMRSIVEKTNVWLWNATTSMFDYPENVLHPRKSQRENEKNLLRCQRLSNSLIFIYSSAMRSTVDEIFSSIRTAEQFSGVPKLSLFFQGDENSLSRIYENVRLNLPTIILKGTGPIANQIAMIDEISFEEWTKIRKNGKQTSVLSNGDFRRLKSIFDGEPCFLTVCQPGRDFLDEKILFSIESARKILGQSEIHVQQFYLAMRWNKINYVHSELLNHQKLIDWTDEELDLCLENGIRFNAVKFVEILFDFGGSLQRLSEMNRSEIFLNLNEDKINLTNGLMITLKNIGKNMEPSKKMSTFIKLFLHWAMEHQYFDLAITVCSRLEDPLTGILLIYQWCEYKEQTDYKTSKTYLEHRRQMDFHAAELIDLFYEDDPENTIKWLNETSSLYENQRASALIDDLLPKKLLASKAMQSYMVERWYGENFHKNRNSIWNFLIILTCLCPVFLLFPFVSRRIFQNDQKENCCAGVRHPFKNFRRFYSENIVIRFRYSVMSYTSFLILYSYVILFDFFPLNIYGEKRSKISRLPIPITEIIVHVFLASIALEEIRQIYLHIKSILLETPYWKDLSGRRVDLNTILSFYRNDSWNILDLIDFSLWIAGFAMRFIVRDDVFVAAKICLSLDLCLWYMRCLHVFLASEELGAKLLMIFHTMKDLVLFLFFILIFLCAYTITTYSLISTSSFVIWTNSTHFKTIQDGGNATGLQIFRNIVEWGTWKIFGSTSLVTSDALDIKYSAENDAYGLVTLFLTITFLIIAYVLLLNNLIALFNFTIQRVHGDSHRAWCNQFYILMKEYEEKDFFVPPFNVIFLPISYFIRKYWNLNGKNADLSEKTSHERERIRRRQQRIAEKYWKSRLQTTNETVTETNEQRRFVCRYCRSNQSDDEESDVTLF